MGLLDFARDVGRQLFDTDAEAADNIKQHLEVSLTGMNNVEVEFDDGVATVSGDCPSEAVREQAILLAGNVKGVERVVADSLRAPEPEKDVEVLKSEIYEIKSGDTLGGIAKQYYGSATKFVRIFEANRDNIRDPNKIYPGQKISIPLD